MFKIAEANEFDAIVPIGDDRHIEPLHSIYKKTAVGTIRDLIKNKKRNVKALIEGLNVKYIDAGELDETTMSFRNLNSVKDL